MLSSKKLLWISITSTLLFTLHSITSAIPIMTQSIIADLISSNTRSSTRLSTSLNSIDDGEFSQLLIKSSRRQSILDHLQLHDHEFEIQTRQEDNLQRIHQSQNQESIQNLRLEKLASDSFKSILKDPNGYVVRMIKEDPKGLGQTIKSFISHHDFQKQDDLFRAIKSIRAHGSSPLIQDSKRVLDWIEFVYWIANRFDSNLTPRLIYLKQLARVYLKSLSETQTLDSNVQVLSYLALHQTPKLSEDHLELLHQDGDQAWDPSKSPPIHNSDLGQEKITRHQQRKPLLTITVPFHRSDVFQTNPPPPPPLFKFSAPVTQPKPHDETFQDFSFDSNSHLPTHVNLPTPILSRPLNYFDLHQEPVRLSKSERWLGLNVNHQIHSSDQQRSELASKSVQDHLPSHPNPRSNLELNSIKSLKAKHLIPDQEHGLENLESNNHLHRSDLIESKTPQKKLQLDQSQRSIGSDKNLLELIDSNLKPSNSKSNQIRSKLSTAKKILNRLGWKSKQTSRVKRL